MGTIVITTNLSLDGVVEDPDGKEGTRLGGWFEQFGGADLGPWARLETDESLGADALLLGRRSDAWFAERWESRTGEWADRLNGMPKFVVSGQADYRPRWANATALGGGAEDGDLVGEVAKLKERFAGEILVYASYRLVRTLIEHRLADELRLVLFPVVLGGGQRLFGETSGSRPLRLLGAEPLGAGLTYLRYQLVREP